MTESNFQTLLDEVDTEKATVLDICKSYNEQNPPPVITDEQFNNHPFFTKNFPSELCKVLELWFSDGTLDEGQQQTFSVGSRFLLKLIKTNSNTKPWLNQQTELINLTGKCLNEIGSYGYYIGVGSEEDPSLESFDWLIQALEKARCEQLINVIIKCVTSRFYIEAFYRLSNVDALSLTITQHFLLVTCPNYILACDINKNHCLKVVDKMLDYYNEIFNEFLPHIQQWTIPVILSLIYPIKITLANISLLTSEQKTIIYQFILTILLNKSKTDPSIEQVRIPLIYTSLCLLIEIMRSDKNLATQLKHKTDEKPDLLNILNDVAKNETNDIIRLKALALISLLVPEEEFLKENNSEQVTGLFVKNFNEALEVGKAEQIDEVLSGLKDLVQNDDVKQEVMKQNGLPSIMKYAKETTDDPLPLEITYAMTFNADAKKVINQDKEFVDHIKRLRESKKGDVSKMAHGIVWKLEGEDNFTKKKEEKEKAKAEEKAKSPEDKSEASTEKEPEKNDMMMSYCWAQKELCHKINDRLEKDGYKVWLDRDEMHGSIIERMAEAIEQSRFVLVCMSSNYKNSINCKAEAEYAFSRKSKIIPLMVEPKYKPDGWLGFMAGSKIYVDFADKDEDEEFNAAYDLLIAELERNGLKDKDNDEKNKTTPTATEPKPEEPKVEPEAPPIQKKEYLTVGPTSVWSDEHVVEFITDNKLDQLIPVCHSMDGEALLEFHYSCQTMPDKMYGIVNNPKEEHPVSLGTFFKFIARLKKFLSPKASRKVQFQYNFVYPPSTTTTDEVKSDNTNTL